MHFMVGIDTGGTFTDVVAFNPETGEVKTVKIPSTPEDPSQAVLNGLRALNINSPDVQFFAHGTTVATNAVVEQKGVETALFITKGTRGVYEARKSNHPSLAWSIMDDPKPPMIVPQRFTKEVNERINFDGSVRIPLDEDSIRVALNKVKDQKVKSIAVCYLFSFSNPKHEQLTEEIIKDEFPGVRVSLSCEILPTIREYVRLSTTVMDAYVGPILEEYLQRLGRGLQEEGIVRQRAYIMQSNGGLMSIDVASSYPVHTLLSGPAAGVIVAAQIAKTAGLENVVSFDMGGTSTDMSVILEGNLTETCEGQVAGQDSGIPMNKISTIGSGGGTIARVDKGGILRVGPDSSGANPGPACYGLGGQYPTVTDADLVLGYLDSESFLGGKFPLNKHLAEKAIGDLVAKPLNMTIEEAAFGIYKVINSKMEVELRLSLMSRGFDPRKFALFVFGGAGPVHASYVAKNVGIKSIMVPLYPGLTSAMGLLLTDIKHSYIKSNVKLLDKFDIEEMNRAFEELIGLARTAAREERIEAGKLNFHHQLDLRYVGQGYELAVDCPQWPLYQGDKAILREKFDHLHEQTYGHKAADEKVECVNFRLTSIVELQKLTLPNLSNSLRGSQPLRKVLKGKRLAYFEEFKGFVETPVYDRSLLQPEQVIKGPAIIEQTDSTIIVNPNTTAYADVYGNILLKIEE